QPGALAWRKGRTMPAGFETLGDDGIHALRLQGSRFGDRGGRAQNKASGLLDARHDLGRRHAEHEADHLWTQVEYQLKPLLIEAGHRIGGLRHSIQAQQAIIEGQARAHPTGRGWIDGWSGMHKEIQVDGPIAGATKLINLIPYDLRGQRRTA